MAHRYIHLNDITTDREHPPLYWVKPPAHHVYDEMKFAALTERWYGDLTNLELPTAPAETYRRVLALVAARGWRIAARDDAGLRVQAVSITPLLRFRDDVVVEVRPAPGGQGSLVAMRSKSRLGRVDFGKNAGRIREFFADLMRG